jgi:hypothetical protein
MPLDAKRIRVYSLQNDTGNRIMKDVRRHLHEPAAEKMKTGVQSGRPILLLT